MDTMKSFKGYGKVDEAEERAFRQRTRRRLIILVAAGVLLLAVVAAAVAGTIIHRRNSSGGGRGDGGAAPPELTPSATLKAVCSVTQYPDSCFSSISAAETANATNPEQFFRLSLAVAMGALQKLPGYADQLASRVHDVGAKAALDVCSGVFDDAVDRLNDSISSMAAGDGILSSSKINDMKTWLSAAITDQETCLDALQEINSTLTDTVRAAMENSTEFVSNSLAIVNRIISLLADFKIPIHRKLLASSPSSSSSSEFPSWLGAAERRLLQDEGSAAAPDLTVAQDGSGDYKTIQEAVDAVPKKNETRFVIHVKAGTYNETVLMDKSKWNVLMYGDGKTKTIVTGSKNFVDGTPTFSTATFAVAGKGFIARDMAFVNTAGAAKHQAVAFRSGSDLSVMYRCAFDAFQDTLYAHSNRQFYRDCDITGTIDFLFGNSAVVFQSCNIQPRQPMANQFNTITAQGKKDPNQNTGISIQKCSITANGNVTAPTYLGRPWKDYSTTVIMQSTIDSLNPKGWIEWVSNVDPPKTIFYGEYQNRGAGASTAQRVAWAGYKPALTATEAGKFTVGTFIQGSEWLPQTRVTFDTAL